MAARQSGSPRYTLGLDVGTQGTKALVVDGERAIVIGRGAAAYDLLAGLPPGAAEQHPDTWIEAVASATRAALAAAAAADPNFRAEAVGAVGVSGQQHGLVVLDGEGAVVRPAKLWCDTTTAAESAEISAALGRPVPTGFTAPKILWMRRHEPAAWARVRRVLLPHDHVNFVLTGAATMEAGDASGTGLLDPTTRAWDRKALHAVAPDLEAKLPATLVAPGAAAGRLDARGADLLGLARGTLVSSGGGDNMMSAIGSGATRPGVVVASLGTSGTVFAYSHKPVIDGEGLIAAFCDSTGGHLPLLCVMNMTLVLEEIRRGYGESLDALTARAAKVAAGAEGLLLVPYLVGERVPDLPHATGALLGVRPGHLDAGHVFRAALEGTAVGLGAGVERLRALGVAVERVRLVGGGARNALWRQIMADVVGVPVVALDEPESAALGAAIQALWTARREAGEAASADAVAAPFVRASSPEVEPTRAHAAVYADLGARMRDATTRLFGPGAAP